MSSFPGSPRLLRGGLVLVDPASARMLRSIPLQYNPDTLTRSLQPQGVGGEGGDRAEALRLKGPPVETIRLEAEIDAADALEFPEQNPAAARLGIHPQLAALETVVYPRSAEVQANSRLADIGTLEIAPAEAPLVLFVWSKHRVLPVRLTELSVIEEAFDPALNPLRARVSLSLRVLSPDDFGFGHTGSSLFMAYHQQKERLGAQGSAASLSRLGLSGVL